MIVRVLTAMIFLVVAGSAMPGAAGSAVPALDPSWAAIIDCPTEPGCHAIVLFDETVLSNLKVPATLSRRRVVKIFTQEGAQEHANLIIHDPSGRENVKNLSARTLLPSGASIPVSSASIMRNARLRSLVNTYAASP